VKLSVVRRWDMLVPGERPPAFHCVCLLCFLGELRRDPCEVYIFRRVSG
jgi:hypothetical protein